MIVVAVLVFLAAALTSVSLALLSLALLAGQL